jgi:hypothetical protein
MENSLTKGLEKSNLIVVKTTNIIVKSNEYVRSLPMSWYYLLKICEKAEGVVETWILVLVYTTVYFLACIEFQVAVIKIWLVLS